MMQSVTFLRTLGSWLVTDRPLIIEYRQFPSNSWVLFSKQLRHVKSANPVPCSSTSLGIKDSGTTEDSDRCVRRRSSNLVIDVLTLDRVSRMRSAGSGLLPVRRACYLNYTHQTTTPPRPTVIPSADIVLAKQFVHMPLPETKKQISIYAESPN